MVSHTVDPALYHGFIHENPLRFCSEASTATRQVKKKFILKKITMRNKKSQGKKKCELWLSFCSLFIAHLCAAVNWGIAPVVGFF